MALAIVTGLVAEARIARAPGVVLLIGGGRGEPLASDLEAAIARGARRLLSFGVAGALAPHLFAGDIIVGGALIDGAARIPCDPHWAAAMMNSLARRHSSLGAEPGNGESETLAVPRIGMTYAPWSLDDPNPRQPMRGAISGLLRAARNDGLAMRVFLADVAAVDAPVADPLAKAALHAASGAAAVDMESAIVARAAARHGLPFAILRAIADPAHRELPAAALAAMRAGGGINLAAIVGALARAPRQLPGLVRLAGDARRAFGALERGRALLGADFASLDLGEL